MTGYIAYIRVSTVKQGVQGVSLQEQRAAILRYAEKNKFTIVLWLEEMETAAKRGRRIFGELLTMLRSGKARGVILHKLDRGVRNLRDWADVGELIDQGVEVHFANDNLDLHSRGGRLAADIQAVVSADYIRNLRDETKKGFYGRLKQGFYPLRAPIGYHDQGKAKAKTIDPVQGPLVRKAFEFYGTGRYSLETLGDKMHGLGLRNKNGGPVTKNGYSQLLNNPFYIGIMQIKKAEESFLGIHEPLISKSLFDRVHAVLSGKMHRQTQRHEFLFRRLISCTECNRSLIGELQKGHVYYRCQGRTCVKASLREETIERALHEMLEAFRFTDAEREYLKNKALSLRASWTTERENESRNAKLKLGQINDRINRLTDAYLDGALDRSLFENRKAGLLMERKQTEETLMNLTREDRPDPGSLEKFLELAENVILSYERGNSEEKRHLIKIVTSNRRATGKNVYFELANPFREIANRSKTHDSGPQQDIPRTLDRLLTNLARLNQRGELPNAAAIFGSHAGDIFSSGFELPVA